MANLWSIRVYVKSQRELDFITLRAKQSGKTVSTYARDLIMKDIAVAERMDIVEKTDALIERQKAFHEMAQPEVEIFEPAQEAKSQEEDKMLKELSTGKILDLLDK